MSQRMERRGFPVESHLVGDDPKPKPAIVVSCSKCPKKDFLIAANLSGSVPPEAGEKLFRKRGWSMGSSRTKDKCPTCAGWERAKSAPEAGLDRLVHIAEGAALEVRNTRDHEIHDLPAEPPPAKPIKPIKPRKPRSAPVAPLAPPPPREPEKEPTMPIPEEDRQDRPGAEIGITADPPRQPTRAQRRAVDEALAHYYDPEAEMYNGSWSDKKLAEKMDVPRAWIAEVREALYGPDRSKAADQNTVKLDAYRARLVQLEEDFLKAMEDFDKRRKEISDLLDKLAAGLQG